MAYIPSLKQASFWLLAVVLNIQCRNKAGNISTVFPDKPGVPSSIQNEHDHILGKLKPFLTLPDSTGRAAVKLNDLMVYHFKEEEDYVFPPLGILPLLADGRIPAESRKILQLTQRFSANYAKLSAEHQMIKLYLDDLMATARKEHHQELAGFDQEINKHAALEEEVLFPAVRLIGQYLQLKSLP